MITFLVLNTLAQVAMVTAGHYNETVLALSGPLGVGIPLLLGIVYGMREKPAYRAASKASFGFSFGGAFIGVVVAILLGDAVVMLLTFAPLSSGITGVLGALLGVKLAGGPARVAGAAA